MSKKFSLLILVVGLAASPALAERVIDETVATIPDGEVSIELIAGSVTVTGWDRSEVQVTGTIGDDVEEPARRRRKRLGRRAAEASSSDDPVRLYLKEIGRVPLLDARQEVRVAARIRRGVEAAEHVTALEEAGELDALDPGELARHRQTGLVLSFSPYACSAPRSIGNVS